MESGGVIGIVLGAIALIFITIISTISMKRKGYL